MGLVAVASGSQIAEIANEHLLSTNTTSGIFVLVVDTNNMTEGDELTLRIKTMAIGSGSARLAYKMEFTGLQGEPVKYSVPVPSNNSITCTLEQTAGTARTFPWSLLRA